jgi:hypothetical protein
MIGIVLLKGFSWRQEHARQRYRQLALKRAAKLVEPSMRSLSTDDFTDFKPIANAFIQLQDAEDVSLYSDDGTCTYTTLFEQGAVIPNQKGSDTGDIAAKALASLAPQIYEPHSSSTPRMIIFFPLSNGLGKRATLQVGFHSDNVYHYLNLGISPIGLKLLKSPET